MKNMANWLIVSKNKWWTNGELTRFWKWGIHQEIELAVPIVVVWVQTSRTHLDRSSLFPSLVTPLRKLSSLLKYVPPKKRSMYRWWSWPVRDHGPAASPQLLLLRPLRLLGTWLWSQGKTSSPKSSFYKSSTAINHVGYPIFQTTSRIPTKNKEIPSAEPMKDAIATWSGAWIKSVKKLHGWYLHVQKSVSLI